MKLTLEPMSWIQVVSTTDPVTVCYTSKKGSKGHDSRFHEWAHETLRDLGATDEELRSAIEFEFEDTAHGKCRQIKCGIANYKKPNGEK